MEWGSGIAVDVLDAVAYPFQKAWTMAWDAIGSAEAEIAAEKTKFANKLKDDLSTGNERRCRIQSRHHHNVVPDLHWQLHLLHRDLWLLAGGRPRLATLPDRGVNFLLVVAAVRSDHYGWCGLPILRVLHQQIAVTSTALR